jgi:DNA-binding HxlR family transcriptional regulator
MVELKQHLKEFGMKHCPIDNSLKVFGKKFTMHIVRNMLLLKQKKFSEFLRTIEGINTKTLSIRLREMESEGLIRRKIIDKRPLRVEYTLTEKGKALEPLLVQIGNFSMQWEPKKIFKKEKPMTVMQTYGTQRLSKIWD